MPTKKWNGVLLILQAAIGIVMSAPVVSTAHEKRLTKEVIVNASLDEVWNAWTTPEGIAKFFSRESKIELRLGGPYELYMDMTPDAQGKRGSEGCKVLSFIPQEMLSFEWNFPPKVSALREAGDKTHVVLRFESMGEDVAKVKFIQLGWQEGKDWGEGYAYFDQAWSGVLDQLREKFAADQPSMLFQQNRLDRKSWIDGHVSVTAVLGRKKHQNFEMTLPLPVQVVWDALATTEGLNTLGGKEPLVELKPGGAYSFWPGANNKVLSYVPLEMLSTSGSAPPEFPNVRKGGTWSAYFFEPLQGGTSTRLRLSVVGWQEGEEWDRAFEYFLKNNPVFLNSVYDKLVPAEPRKGTGALHHEGIVDAPVAEVWKALTTKEGLESWMLPHAEIDLRVGGKMLTHYDPNGKIGDPGTIENTILSLEPNRMFSIRATKPPDNFPFTEEIKDMWTVIYLDESSPHRTLVTLVGMGFGDDERSQKMRVHFDKGNAWTLQKLQERFSKADSAAGRQEVTSDFQSYVAHIAAAELSLRLNDSASARRWLEAAPQLHRGWEWRHLVAQLDQSMTTFPAHQDTVFGLALSNDGRRLATASNDGTVRVWDTGNGSHLTTLHGHEKEVYAVAFSPDGKRIASASRDGTSRLWDAHTGEELSTIWKHDRPVSCVAFSPDGSRIITSSYKITDGLAPVVGIIKVWDSDSGAELRELACGNKPISMLHFSADGTRVAVSSWDESIYIWDVERGLQINRLLIPDEGLYRAVDCVTFNPDGSRVAAGAKDKTARIWDAVSGELLATLRGHTGFVNAVAFSPDGLMIATASEDDSIRLWDCATFKETSILRGHHSAVRCLAFADDGSQLISGSADRSVKYWNPHCRNTWSVQLHHPDSAYAVPFSPDGALLATCGYAGTAAIWDTHTWKKLATWTAHEGSSCNTIAFSPDGTKVATCSWDKTAKIWDARSRTLLATLSHDDGVSFVAFSPDGQFIATAVNDKTIRLWQVGSAQETATLTGHTKAVNSIAFSPNGKLLASASTDSTVRIWDVASATERSVLRDHQSGVESVAFSPDGLMIASGSHDGTARLWKVDTGEQLAMLLEDDSPVYRVAFSPDGRRVVTASNVATFVDVDRAQVVSTLRPHRDALWSLSFSPDGSQLATCSPDGTIVVSDTKSLSDRVLRTPGHVHAATKSP